MSPVSSVESWFFSSLGWKVPMPTRSFSLRTTRRTLDVLHDLAPVAVVEPHEVLEDLAAERVGLARDADLARVVLGLVLLVEALEQGLPGVPGTSTIGSSCIGLGKARAAGLVIIAVLGGDFAAVVEHPREGVERALGRAARVVLEALLQQARDGGLAGAHRPVQQQDALVGAVALGRGAEEVDELHEREVEPEDPSACRRRRGRRRSGSGRRSFLKSLYRSDPRARTAS
jgi:hypothetical protein